MSASDTGLSFSISSSTLFSQPGQPGVMIPCDKIRFVPACLFTLARVELPLISEEPQTAQPRCDSGVERRTLSIETRTGETASYLEPNLELLNFEPRRPGAARSR
jgi:hypothetical protein